MKSLRHLRAFLFLAVVLLISTAYLDAQNQYYVSITAGSDANNGTSVGTPWKNISHAIATANLTGGATINVAAGTYTEAIANCSGRTAAICMNRSGPSTTQRFAIICTTPLSCLLRNNSVNGGITVVANNVDVQGFDYGNNANAIVGVIVACTPPNLASGNCSSGNSVHILSNFIHDISQTANDGAGGGAGCPSFGALYAGSQAHGTAFQNDVQFIGNRISNFGDQTKAPRNGGSCNVAHGIYSNTPNVFIANNVIVQVPTFGVQLYNQACNSSISNNTIDQAGKGDIVIANGTTCSQGPSGHVSILNNILESAPNGGVTLGTGGGSPCTSTSRVKIANNLTSVGLAITNGNLNGCTDISGTITEAPTTTFNGYSGTSTTNNYALKSGSAATGAGISSPGACVSGGPVPCVPSIDFTDASRPLSGAQDNGAYKFVGVGVPIVSFSPSPLAFGALPVSSGLTLTATLTNTGSANLTLSAAISGTNAGDFVLLSTTCANPLAGGASCTFSIRFTPSATGARSANLTLNDNAAGSPHQLPLTGSGGSGTATLTPSPVSFPVTTPGSCSVPQNVTLSNTGSVAFNQNANSTITPNQIEFQFSLPIGSCANGAVAPGASCTTSVRFCPSAAGNRTATFNAFTDANDPSATMNGVGGAPVVSLTPASWDFGSIQAGTASPAKVFTLTNTGNAPLVFTISTSSSVFAQGNTCTSPMAPAVSCNISVTFQPSGGGPQSGVLSVNSNAASTPNTSTLTGTGATPASLVFSPPTVNFPNTLTGSSSDPVTITVTNPNAIAVTTSGITLIGTNAVDFGVGTCPGSIPAGGTCSLTVTFSPLTAGSKTATVSIADSASGSPHQATLNGLATIATMTLGPPLTFGNQVVGTTSGAQNAAFSNSGNGPMTFTIALAGTSPGDFILGAATCTSPIGGGQNCLVPVQFKPTTSGARSATVRFTDNASGSPHSLAVSGTGLAATPAVCPSVLTFNFGNQPVNTTSGTQPFTITNCGTSNMSIAPVSVTGNFTQTNNCGTIVPGAFCTINVAFAPLAAGNLSGSINIPSNAATSIDHIALSGFGTQTGGTLLPAPLPFGSHTVGTTTGLNLTFTNTGNTSVTLPAPTVGGANAADFTPNSSCATVAPGATCTMSVSFVPGGAGSRTAVLSQLVGSAQMTINLSGTGVAAAPAVSLDHASLDFGNVQQSSTSDTKTVQLTNSGTAALTISTILPTGANAADYTVTTHCPGSVAAGSVCTVDVSCTPSGVGARIGSLTFTDNASDSPQAVVLSCNGTSVPAPRVVTTPLAGLSFPSTQVGTTSGALVSTVTNNGNANLIFSTIGVGGANIGDFQLDSTCPTGPPGLAPGLNCALTVNFQPLAAGSRSASLIVTDSASDSPQSIPLSGSAFLGEGNVVIPISSINFGNTVVGTTSTPVVFTLMNNGGAAAAIAVQISNEFIESDTCSGSISAGGVCSVTLTFSPQSLCGQFNEDHSCANDIHAGQFVVTSNAVNSPQTVVLQGTAIVQTPPTGPVVIGIGGNAGGGGNITAGVR